MVSHVGGGGGPWWWWPVVVVYNRSIFHCNVVVKGGYIQMGIDISIYIFFERNDSLIDGWMDGWMDISRMTDIFFFVPCCSVCHALLSVLIWVFLSGVGCRLMLSIPLFLDSLVVPCRIERNVIYYAL